MDLELLVDDRELRGPAARKLYSLGVKLVSKRLPVGDFVVSGRIGLERKTAADFESSIVDGRLFSQAQEMVAAFEAPLLAVVGSGFSRLQPSSIRGAEISLATDFRIPVFHFNSEDELAEFLHALVSQKSKAKKELALRYEKKTFTLAERQRFVVESFPGIGPHHAKALLRHFKTIERLFTAGEKELQEVNGVGPERAKEIRRVASSAYEE